MKRIDLVKFEDCFDIRENCDHAHIIEADISKQIRKQSPRFAIPCKESPV